MKNKKRRLISIAIILALALGGVGFYVYAHNTKDTAPKLTSEDEGYVNLDPPTEQDKSYSESRKDDIANGLSEDNTEPNGNSATKKNVSPFITRWGVNKTSGNLEVNGFVSGVIESNGKCTLTLKQSGSTVTESKDGTANATNTTCGLISVSGVKLKSGKWSATLEYSSPTSSGASEETTITI